MCMPAVSHELVFSWPVKRGGKVWDLTHLLGAKRGQAFILAGDFLEGYLIVVAAK